MAATIILSTLGECTQGAPTSCIAARGEGQRKDKGRKRGGVMLWRPQGPIYLQCSVAACTSFGNASCMAAATTSETPAQG